jgi:septal ring factor EnvC (AmiA/AmiB activator)
MSIEKYQHGGGANFGWMDETPTPRTDAARFEALRDSAFRWDCIPLKLGQELEREIEAHKKDVFNGLKIADEWADKCVKAEAEVAKLNHQLLKTESDLLQSQDINSFLDTEFRIACKRAEKAEAEVERLTGILKSLRKSPSTEWHKSNKVLLK